MRRAQAGKRKRPEKSAGNDSQPSQATTPSVTPSSSFVMDGSSKETKQVSLLVKYISTTQKIHPKTSNPIYYFYKAVQDAPQGIKAEDGDKFYQCYYGGRKILRVTKKMRNNLNGMFYAPRVTEFNLSTFGVIIQALSGISELLCLTCSSSILTSEIVSRMHRSRLRRNKLHQARSSSRLRNLLSLHNVTMLINSPSRMHLPGNRRKLQ